MALFTSEKKYFEVTDVSFTPDVMTVGEEVSYSITVKNVSGKKITSMYSTLSLYYPDANGRISSSDNVYMYGGPSFDMKSISWTSGASKTFTGKFKFTTSSYHTYLPKIDDRLMPVYPPVASTGSNNRGLRIGFTTNATFNDGTNNDYIHDIRGANSEYLKVIGFRYSPTILNFNAERSIGNELNDEGTNLLTTISLKLNENSRAELTSLKLLYRNSIKPEDGWSSIDLTSKVNDALAGKIQVVITSYTFATNTDYDLILQFGDQYESAEMPLYVSRAFANVHLSGKPLGGVCFGSFSKSTDTNPLFECCYPAKFFNGIDGVTNYSEDEMLTGGAWIDGKPIYRKTVSGTVTTTAGTAKSGVIGTLTNVATIVNMYGAANRSDAAFDLSMYASASNYNRIAYTAGNIQFTTTHTATAHVTIEYTKTTN